MILESLYFDYQAATPVDSRILEAMAPYWHDSFGNPHSSEHSVGWSANEAIETSKRSLGELVNADPDEIIFTSGATEANNLALLGLARGLTEKTGRNRVLISAIEHKCILSTARVLSKKEGFAIETIPVDKFGYVDLERLESRISDDVLLCSVILVNNEIGTIQKLSEIKNICRKFDVLLHSDAAQAPVALDLPTIAQETDLMSLSSHKMYGPMGIGALYISREIQLDIEPIIYGGGQQNNLRSGTLPLPLCVGMGEAAKLWVGEEAASARNHLSFLRDYFTSEMMSKVPGTELNGPPLNERHPGNTNLRFEGLSGQNILSMLQPKLAASSGAACASGISEPSHVLRAIGLSETEADSSIRFSMGTPTTKQHIDEAVDLLTNVLANDLSAS